MLSRRFSSMATSPEEKVQVTSNDIRLSEPNAFNRTSSQPAEPVLVVEAKADGEASQSGPASPTHGLRSTVIKYVESSLDGLHLKAC